MEERKMTCSITAIRKEKKSRNKQQQSLLLEFTIDTNSRPSLAPPQRNPSSKANLSAFPMKQMQTFLNYI